MTDEARNIALGAGVALILLVSSCELKATDSEYLKQILRLQTTEFCATVGKPPQVIADALNKALEQVTASPAFVSKLESLGITPRYKPTAEFKTFIDAEARWGVDLLKAMNVKAAE